MRTSGCWPARRARSSRARSAANCATKFLPALSARGERVSSTTPGTRTNSQTPACHSIDADSLKNRIHLSARERDCQQGHRERRSSVPDLCSCCGVFVFFVFLLLAALVVLL